MSCRAGASVRAFSAKWKDRGTEVEVICPGRCPGAETLVDAVAMLANQGATAIEIAVDDSGYFDFRKPQEVEKLLCALQRCGIRVHSVHAPFGANYDISSLEDEIHENGVDALIDCIEIASMIDTPHIIVHASDKLSDRDHRRFDRARGVLREMALLAQESGLMMAVENLPPGYLGHTPDEMFWLLEDVDTRTTGICFDTGHANLSGHFEDFARALLPRAICTHIHDNDGNSDRHLFPGLGTINWPTFSRIYHECNCSAGIMLECALPDGIDWSEASHRFRMLMEP